MWTRIMPLNAVPMCEDGDCKHRDKCSMHISADETRRNSCCTPALAVLPNSPPQAWTGTSGPCLVCSRHVFTYELAKPEPTTANGKK